MSQQPICLFDSGIGGLTVLKKFIDKFPNENYIYFADLARVPFGDKTKDEIKTIANEIINWLLKFNPKIIIMACNTSSAIVETCHGTSLQGIPLYGMIDPCASEIAKSRYTHVTIWATSLVVKNNAYKNAIQKLNPKIKVEEIACPKLVPMIEDLNFNSSDKDKIIQEYLDKTSKDSQALIFGCTHYPLIENNILKLKDIETIDPADVLLREIEKNLSRDAINRVSTSQISIYTTAQVEKLQKFAKLYLCQDIKVNLVSLNKLSV